MSADLLPCPFCGGACQVSKGHATEQVWPHSEFHRVFCTACQTRQLFHRTADEAITAWNRRAPVQAQGVSEPTAEKASGLPFDTGYVGRKLAIITRDLSHYTAQEMARELVRLAKVSDEGEAIKEAAPVLTDAKDAARWRALLGSARIRIIGSAGINQDTTPYGEPYNNYAHFGMEIWTKYGRDYSPELLDQMDKGNVQGREVLTKYADIAIDAAIERMTGNAGEGAKP